MNELAILTILDDFGFPYIHMNINKFAFYKARFGEIEYYDTEKYLPYKDVRPKLKQLAGYFNENPGRLNLAPMYMDIETVKEILEQISTTET
ncbi:hypothetical protein [Bacillus pseudomycoides]|uniref:hypothetical protein n=1 Tax=Bacillus pseudomycoides TaxID=64104 RepID=UPI00211D8FD7|nr:hypothetical protein [Bacillus pseudomycoides]